MTKNMADTNDKTKMSDNKPRQKVTTPGDAEDRNRSTEEQQGHDAGGLKNYK